MAETQSTEGVLEGDSERGKKYLCSRPVEFPRKESLDGIIISTYCTQHSQFIAFTAISTYLQGEEKRNKLILEGDSVLGAEKLDNS